MRKLSLFSGIGGIDLAAHWAGMETVAFCEREPFPQKVLQKNFPGVPIYDDVCTLTAERLKEDGIIGDGRTIDIISAGYPCQPFSNAGKRRGAEDDRHLWPEVARLLHEVRPTWFLGENVAGHITLGLDEVLTDLEGLGYTAQPFVIPASAIYAGHRRDRVFIVGHTTSPGFQEWRQPRRTESQEEARARLVTELERSGETLADTESGGRSAWRAEQQGQQRELCTVRSGSSCTGENVAHATCERCGETWGDQCERSEKRPAGCSTNVAYTNDQRQQECNSTTGGSRMGHHPRCADEVRVHGTAGATQPRVGGDTDELPNGLDGRGIDSLDDLIDLIHEYPQPALMGMPQYDWEPPRVATGVKDRTGRLKALGNAVDPLQIYPIMAAIKAIHDQL